MMARLGAIARSPGAQIVGTIMGLALMGLVLRQALADTASFRFSPLPAAGAVALFGLSWAGLGLTWTLLATGRADHGLAGRWFRSQLLRYVPGGIWAPVSRFADMDGDRRFRAKLLLIETASILTTATAISAALAAAVLDMRWALLAVAAVAGMYATIGVVQRLGRSGRVTALWCVALAASLGAYLLASALAQDAVTSGIPFWKAAAAGLLSWVAGYVIIIAPSGAGAKEWAYIGILAAYGTSEVAAGVLAARVLFVVAELLVLASFAAVGRLSRGDAGSEDGSEPRSSAVRSPNVSDLRADP